MRENVSVKISLTFQDFLTPSFASSPDLCRQFLVDYCHFIGKYYNIDIDYYLQKYYLKVTSNKRYYSDSSTIICGFSNKSTR